MIRESPLLAPCLVVYRLTIFRSALLFASLKSTLRPNPRNMKIRKFEITLPRRLHVLLVFAFAFILYVYEMNLVLNFKKPERCQPG